MAGQIIPRGERTWLVRIFDGRDSVTGKRKYINKTIHGTKKDAQAYLHKALHEKDLGTFIEPSKKTLDEYLDQWLESAARPRLRENTFSEYTYLLKKHVRPMLGKRSISQLTPLEIQALYSKMQEKGLSPRTIRYTHAVLHSALKQAHRWRMIQQNPADMVELPKAQRREMAALSSAEVAKFLEAAKDDTHYTLFLVALTTGMRPSEYLGLKWDDINLTAGTISVRRSAIIKGSHWSFKEPKTARSRRVVKLSPTIIKALETHLKAQQKARAKKEAKGKNVVSLDAYRKTSKKVFILKDSPNLPSINDLKKPAKKITIKKRTKWHDLDLVFPNGFGLPLDPKNLIRRHFKPILEKAGLVGKKIRLYDLRHTCATLLLEAGENPKIVSERLGHANITLTLDTYSHVLPDMQQKAAEKLEALLFNK